jgi:hypothetical protein
MTIEAPELTDSSRTCTRLLLKASLSSGAEASSSHCHVPRLSVHQVNSVSSTTYDVRCMTFRARPVLRLSRRGR